MKDNKVLYVCDRRACEKCSIECNHTSDIRHAVNFELVCGDIFAEKDFIALRGVDLAEGNDFTVLSCDGSQQNNDN